MTPFGRARERVFNPEEPPHDWPCLDTRASDMDRWQNIVLALLAGLIVALAAIVIFVALMVVSLRHAHAHDSTGYWARLAAEGKAPPKEWWDRLASGKGLCCSVSDGRVVEDPDVEMEGTHYRVRIDGQWLDVPDDALVTVPNKFGRPIVWPMTNADGTLFVRCFMPGAGT